MTKETLEKANELKETIDTLNNMAYICDEQHLMFSADGSYYHTESSIAYTDLLLPEIEDEFKKLVKDFCNAKYNELKEEFDKL